MASVEKFTLAAVVNEIRHNNRTIKNSSNPDIDRNKINLNYSLTPDRHISEYDYFKQRKSECFWNVLLSVHQRFYFHLVLW